MNQTEKCAEFSNDDIFESFLYALKEKGRSENTIKTYHTVLQSFCVWLAEKNKNLHKLTRDDVQGYMNFLSEDNKSLATVDKIYNTINVFARHLGKPELTDKIQRKKKTKENLTVPVGLSKEERLQLTENIREKGNARNTAIVYTLLHTGIRVSELCALNKSDIQKVDDTFYVQIKKHAEGKERTIPVTSTCMSYITDYLLGRTDDNPALFLSNYTKRISVRSVQHMLQQYEANPHKLRHTFCYELIEKGFDISVVADLAGHSDINITKQYIRSSNRDKLASDIDEAFA